MNAPDSSRAAQQVRGVVVVLPSSERFDDTVLAAAEHAGEAGVELTVAVVLPQPHPLAAWAGGVPPYPDLRFDCELQITTELMELLGPSGVRWRLVLIDDLVTDLPPVLRELDADVVLVHHWRFLRRRKLTALARRCGVRIHLVRPDGWLSF